VARLTERAYAQQQQVALRQACSTREASGTCSSRCLKRALAPARAAARARVPLAMSAEQVEALPTILAALRAADEDACAAHAALVALAAPAYALPPWPVVDGEHVVAHEELRWAHLATAAAEQGLLAALKPLLADERFVDDALELLVPVLACLNAGENVAVRFAGLATPLAALIALSPWEDVKRVERALRAMIDLYGLAVAEDAAVGVGDVADRMCVQALVPSLVALLRRPPASKYDGLAGGAAKLLCEMAGLARSARGQGALSAAVAALADSVHCVQRHEFGGFPCGAQRHMHASCSLVALVWKASVTWFTPEEQPAHLLQDLIMVTHPGACAAVMHALTSVLVADDANVLRLAHTLLEISPSWGRTALLDPFCAMREMCEHPTGQASISVPAAVQQPSISWDWGQLGASPPEQIVTRGTIRASLLDACSGSAAEEILRHPPAERQLAAVVSAAFLSPYTQRIAEVLADGDRMQLLLRGCVSHLLSTPGGVGNAVSWLDAARHKLLGQKLLAAVACIVKSTGVSNAVPQQEEEAQEPYKRLRQTSTTAVALSAADVNVKRYDSLTLLIDSRPLFVNGMLLEAASPLLADLLSVASAAAEDKEKVLPPIAVPPPADVDPASFYNLFLAAVEHTYTSGVEGLAEASLLPLWCVARHLQMDVLQRWCADKVGPVLHRDEQLLRSAGALALRYRSERLLAMVSVALLTAPLSEPALLSVLVAASGRSTEDVLAAAGQALADSMAAVLLDALRGLCRRL
jgi:hypothetical protein